MKITNLAPVPLLHSVVKSIIVLEGVKACKLPFYADGFPGLIFKQTSDDAFLLPRNKKLTDFFLYGQTIKPIEIAVTGGFRLIVFQLYPFSLKILFNVDPKQLNDDCYDLRLLNTAKTDTFITRLQKAKSTNMQVKIISEYLKRIISKTTKQADLRVQLAINLIVESKGTKTVKELTEQLHITERTLQRQFIAYVGVSPKQFSKIIQFQFSLNQISEDSLVKLTKIVYQSGYADQSHFIRDFKKYAGQNPKAIKKRK
jgi:AraC-like DNA-binding protein